MLKELLIGILVLGGAIASQFTEENALEECRYINGRIAKLHLEFERDESVLKAEFSAEYEKIKIEHPNMVFFKYMSLEKFIYKLLKERFGDYYVGDQLETKFKK